MNSIIKEIRSELKKLADEATKRSGERFFKEEVKIHGVKTAAVHRISRKFFKDIRDKNKSEIFILCEELWLSGYLEESFIACDWSYFLRKDFALPDFKIFEKWVYKYVSNWASCDNLCNHTVGAFVEMYPEKLSTLKKWARSKNRWTRRASAVSLIVPARHGMFLKDIIEIAEILLQDQDDMVQKGCGWMLKSAGEAHQAQIYNYVIKNKKIMPRTALRYAIEKMPPQLKKEAMKK